MANRTVTVFKSSRKGAFFGTGSILSFTWTFNPGSGAEDQNVTGVTWDGKYLIFCTDENNPALGTSARFVVVDPSNGSIIQNINAGIPADGGYRDICWDGKDIIALDHYANDAVPTCAISRYDRKTGIHLRTIVSGLSLEYWSITFDGKYILALVRPSGGSPQCYIDVFHPRTGNIITRKIFVNVLDFGINIHPGIGWDGKYILNKSCPQSFAATPLLYKAHHRRLPDSGAGVITDCLSTATTNPRTGEGRSITWDGKYLYDFTQT